VGVTLFYYFFVSNDPSTTNARTAKELLVNIENEAKAGKVAGCSFKVDSYTSLSEITKKYGDPDQPYDYYKHGSLDYKQHKLRFMFGEDGKYLDAIAKNLPFNHKPTLTAPAVLEHFKSSYGEIAQGPRTVIPCVTKIIFRSAQGILFFYRTNDPGKKITEYIVCSNLPKGY
jgi:hypothetical protein